MVKFNNWEWEKKVNDFFFSTKKTHLDSYINTPQTTEPPVLVSLCLLKTCQMKEDMLVGFYIFFSVELL